MIGLNLAKQKNCTQLLNEPICQPVIQMKNIPVGYDRIGIGGANDVLYTDGLANCIAIVAYDRKNLEAVMSHFNTVHAIIPIDGGGYTFNRAAFRKFKGVIDLQLKGFWEGHNFEYFVCLGRVWYNARGTFFDWRHDLIGCCIEVFNHEPTVVGSTAWFDVNSGILRGNLGLFRGERPTEFGEGTNNQGLAIDYGSLSSGK